MNPGKIYKSFLEINVQQNTYCAQTNIKCTARQKKLKKRPQGLKKSTWLTSEAEEATAIKASVAAKKDFMWTLGNMKFGQKGVEKCRCVELKNGGSCR